MKVSLYLGRSNRELRAWLKPYNIKGISRFRRKHLLAVYCAIVGRHYPNSLALIGRCAGAVEVALRYRLRVDQRGGLGNTGV